MGVGRGGLGEGASAALGGGSPQGFQRLGGALDVGGGRQRHPPRAGASHPFSTVGAVVVVHPAVAGEKPPERPGLVAVGAIGAAGRSTAGRSKQRERRSIRAVGEQIEVVAGALHRAHGRLGLPLAGEDQTVLGAGHRHVEGAHPLGRLDPLALRLDPVEAGGGGAEQPELPALAGPPHLDRRVAVAAGLALELDQVDVGEIEPLGGVDGHHLDGVVGPLVGARLLGVERLGDALAEAAQHRGGVAAAVFEHPHQAGKEALEVGEAIRTQVAGGLDRLGEEEARARWRRSGRPGRRGRSAGRAPGARRRRGGRWASRPAPPAPARRPAARRPPGAPLRPAGGGRRRRRPPRSPAR